MAYLDKEKEMLYITPPPNSFYTNDRFYANNAPIAPKTPADATPIIIPASNTPSITAITLDLKSISNKLTANVPVHAPVPESGTPTNSNNATDKPLPAFSFNFCPPFFPFSRQNVKITDIWLVFSPF